MNIQLDRGLYYLIDPVQPGKRMSNSLEFQPGIWKYKDDDRLREYSLTSESRGSHSANPRYIGNYYNISGKIIMMHEDDIHLWPDKIIVDIPRVLESILRHASHDILVINAKSDQYRMEGILDARGELIYFALEDTYQLSTPEYMLELLYISMQNPVIGDIILPAAKKIMGYIERVLGINIDTPDLREILDLEDEEYINEGIIALYKAYELAQEHERTIYGPNKYMAPMIDLVILVDNLLVLQSGGQKIPERSIYSVHERYIQPAMRDMPVFNPSIRQRSRSPPPIRLPRERSPVRSPRPGSSPLSPREYSSQWEEGRFEF